MKAEDLPDLAIEAFLYYYRRLIEGETGLIEERSIRPVDTLPDLETLDSQYREIGQSVLDQAVMLKLNGGLGTSMGLQKAKSLLPVKSGLSFLDLIAKQALHWDVPLVLMDSFSTAEDSRAHLEAYPGVSKKFPVDFLQHKAPKITQSDYAPVAWPRDPSLEWCPPGHGDIYTALLTTGMLDRFLDAGTRFVFVSNSDNLGARLDLSILGYFCDRQLPFLMEVADRTPVDRKGGHLALALDGRLLLRESAQCPKEDLDQFQDINRHKYFNTNNLWIDLRRLKEVLVEKEGILGLPMIRNSKTVDPRDPDSEPIYQLETAMGAAIEVFAGAGALRVPRSRFAPVKTTSQLLAVRSDAYVLKEDFSIVLDESRQGIPCQVFLDEEHYKSIDQLDLRFPAGPPSLLRCSSLQVEGDVVFGEGVACVGDVAVKNATAGSAHIPAGAHLEGRVEPAAQEQGDAA